MSETVTLTLKASEYDAAFGLAIKFDGPVSRYAGEKIVSAVQAEVVANKKEDGSVPDSIKVSLERRYFEGFYQGLKEFLNKDGITSADVALLCKISKVFKINKRIQKFVDEKLGELVDLEPLDDELLDSE